MDRRHFLKLTIGASAGTVAGAQLVGAPFSSALGLGDGVFQYGVASGDPLPNGIVLWTRLTPTPDCTPGSGRGKPCIVRWVVAKDPNLEHVVRRGRVRTDAATDHVVKLDVRRLLWGCDYYYGFEYEGERSPVGHFRTAPAHWEDPDHVRFGHVSCSNYAHGFFSAYGHLAARDDLDFILHVGDYLYEYENGGYGDFRPLDPPTEIVTLTDYRRRFALYRSDPDLMAAHRQHAFVATIDDHEITNDAWSDGAENHDPSEGDYGARKRAAMQAYREWMPVRIPGRRRAGHGSEDTRLYRSLQFGCLADLTMLDLRQHRSEQVTDFANADDPERTMLGDRQERWFKRILRRQHAPYWRLIGNSVQMMQVRYPLGFLPDGQGTFRNVDAWDGYRPERTRLLDRIGESGDRFDAVFLTGDIHSTWASDLRPNFDDPTSSSVATEFVCTSVTSDTLNEILGLPPRSPASIQLEEAIVGINPHVDLLEFDSHGYSVVDIDHDRARSDWYYISDREDPDATSTFAFARQTSYGSKSIDANAPTTPLG